MKSIYIFFLTLIISTNVFGQSDIREGEETSDTTINLITEINDTISIILLDKMGYTVKTPLKQFKVNFNKWLKQHPHLHSDRKLLNLIIEQSKDNCLINAAEIAADNNLSNRLEYRLADLLSNGQCMVINKKQNKEVILEVILEVKIQTYSYYCGLLCGDGGRRFFVNGMLLLEVMDWIS